MRILLILIISLGITMPVSAQSATMGKVLVTTLKKADVLIGKGGRLGRSLFTKTARKTLTKGEFREYTEKQLRIGIRDIKQSKSHFLPKAMTQSDLIEKASLAAKLRKLGYSDQLIKQFDELPITKELSQAIQKQADDPQLLEQLAKDLKGGEALLKAMNETPMVNAYSKLVGTSLLTDESHLRWIQTMQHYSSKVSNQRKLMNKYNIKDLRVTEKDGVISYYDGDELLAQEKNNVLTAWSGNAPGAKAAKGKVNNFLNQNLLPNSKYVVDGKYE